MRRSRIILRLSLIVVVGLAARIWVAAISPAVSRDTCSFVWHAQRLSEAPLETVRREHQHPLYPALIAAAHTITTHGLDDPILSWQVAAQAVAACAGVLVALAMYALTRCAFDDRIALLAALFAVLLPEAVQYSSDGLSDLPHALFYLLALAAGTAALRGGRLWLWVAAGASSALAFLVRPEGLEAAVVVVLVACTGRVAISLRRRLIGTALLICAAAMLCAPYMLTAGRLVPKKDVFRLFGLPPATQSAAFESAPALNEAATHTANQSAMCAAGLPREAAWALFLVLKDWVRSTRVVYLLVAVAAFVGVGHPRADRVAGRVLATAWGLHFLVLIALVLNYDYGVMLSKRHTLLLALLILPYSAAGTMWLADRLAGSRGPAGRRRMASILIVLVVVLSPIRWMLRPINADAEYLVRAGQWIREHRAEILPRHDRPGLLLTTDNRIPFYAGMKMQNWNEASGDLGVLEDHLRSFRPDIVALDEYRILRHNPDFLWELEERLVRSGVLEVLRMEVPRRGRLDTRLWMYRVVRSP